MLLMVQEPTEYADRAAFETRTHISSARLDIERLATGVRGPWGVESRDWNFDVEPADDLSRYRAGYGARPWPSSGASPLVSRRASQIKRSVKTRRKAAGWNPQCLLQILPLM